MTEAPLSLNLDAEVTECGDTLAGEVTWGPVDPAPRRVTVALRFATTGAGIPPDSGGTAEVVFEGSASGKERFELIVPLNGPISFVGRSISVSWELEAKLDQRARRDPSVRHPVTVLPGGGLAVWARQSAAPPEEQS